MLEWTGERFLPWLNDPALAYEHLHRYWYASQFVSGKTVLDLASGEGYGSCILAQSASRVVGIDIDLTAVAHAKERYALANLEFRFGSITSVPVPEAYAFDVIVCFEAIEHIENHDALLSEIVRLLKPEGLLIVSTPNKNVYDAAIQAENEFHLKELEFEEFRDLLAAHFQHVRFLGQRIFGESCLWPVESSGEPAFRDYAIQRGSEEFERIPLEALSPMYYVALASNAGVPEVLPASALHDNGNELLVGKDLELQAVKRASEEALRWRQQQLDDRESQIASLTQARQWFEQQLEERGRAIASLEEALQWRTGQVEGLTHEKTELLSRVDNLTRALQAVYDSSSWKFAMKLRRIAGIIIPAGSRRRSALSRLFGIDGSR